MTVVMAVSAALFAVLLHASIVRWLSPRFYISAIGASCIISLVLTALIALEFGRVLPVSQWLLFTCLVPSLLAAYALLFMGVAWDSPTLALVNEIADHGATGMPIEFIDAFVRCHPFVHSRLDAMMKSGVLVDDGELFSFRQDVGLMVRFAEIYRGLAAGAAWRVSVQPILIAVAGLMVAVVGHLAALRAGLGVIAAYLASLLTGTFFTLMLTVLISDHHAWDVFAASLLLFGAWWFVFLNFVQCSQSSLRVNILRQALLNGGTLTHAALFARYNDDALIRLRLDRLVQSGAIAQVNDRYFVISSSARMLGGLFRGLKLLILGRPSEFHSLAGQSSNRSQEQ